VTKKKKSKLALKRRAVRRLSDRQLDQVPGGVSYVATGESLLYEDPVVVPLGEPHQQPPTGTTSLRHQTNGTATR
jgi:hypothetical protein